MKRIDRLLGAGAALVACSVLGGCTAFPGGGGMAPVARHAAGPPPADLRRLREQAQLPPLAGPGDVARFVDAAGAAPVSRREEIRAIIQGVQGNAEIANALVAEFETARKSDFSRALVILSLIGEQRNAAGTAFLAAFVWQPLPKGGRPIVELGISAAAEAMERLQVKAANALPYARTPRALQATLEVVGRHPLKAVRAEAASSYLWNRGNSEEARQALSGYLRADERMLLDRPVHVDGMGAEEFNRLLELYLERHPELRPPSPQRDGPVPPVRAANPAASVSPGAAASFAEETHQ